MALKKLMEQRKIAIFTGNRAEYGLQSPVLRAVDAHPELTYQLVVSGAHLDLNFGNTLQEIKNDGFRVDAEVVIEMDAKSLYSTAQAIGFGIIETSKVLAKLNPDVFVVYADRFEGLAAVIAASQMNIPTAHIEGGDLTEGGALDDSVRHAMTKLSHLHFTTNTHATNRILAMGEEAWRIHTVGFPAIDLIAERRFATAKEIEEQLKIDLKKPIVLFTQHSVTTEFDQAADQVEASLAAMLDLAEDGVQVILTYPNNDAGGRQIIQAIHKHKALSHKHIQLHQSLGRHLYHGVMALAENPDILLACVGNSSSGIKETPIFGCPTINIGSRQEGRLRGDNVIDVHYSSSSIYEATRQALHDQKFREKCRKTNNPYWLGDAGKKIANVLASINLDHDLLRKKMTLIGEVEDGWYR